MTTTRLKQKRDAARDRWHRSLSLPWPHPERGSSIAWLNRWNTAYWNARRAAEVAS